MAQALKSGQLPVDRLIDERASLGERLSDLTTPLMSAPKRCTREEFITKIQSINWGDSTLRMQMLIIRILQVKTVHATTFKAPYGTQ